MFAKLIRIISLASILLLSMWSDGWADYIGSWKIDDALTFTINTNGSTGAVDADSVPSYRIYEDETGTAILTGSYALIDASNTNGFYSEQVTLSAANGIEKGKRYTVQSCAILSTITTCVNDNFQIEAEVDANVVSPTLAVTIATGGIGPLAFTNSGTLSVEAGTTLSLGTGSVITANDQFNLDKGGYAVEFYSASTGGVVAHSCIADTVQGTPDQVVTFEDITGNTTVGDGWNIISAPSCDIHNTGYGLAVIEAQTDDIGTAGAGLTGIPLNIDIATGTLDAAQIGTDAITAAKIAADSIGSSEIATDAIGAAEIAADAIGSSEIAAAAITSSEATSVGSVIGNVGGNVLGTVAGLTSAAMTNVENAVWNATIASHVASGSTGESLSAAGTAGDPWLTDLSTYTIGQAGYLVNTNLNATVSSRSTLAASDNIGINWADVSNPTTTLTLSGTTIGATTNVTNGVTTTSGDKNTLVDLVWDEVLAGHSTSGTTGAGLIAAGSAGDPWSTAVPGAYGAGTAGFIVGTNLNATVSSRFPTASAPTNFSSTAIDGSGRVQIQDGTSAGQIDTSSGGIAHVILSDMITTYTGNTPQTGNVYPLVDTEIATIDDFVDTEVAAIKTQTDKLNTAMELDGSNYRFTTNALEQAPTGGGGGSLARAECDVTNATSGKVFEVGTCEDAENNVLDIRTAKFQGSYMTAKSTAGTPCNVLEETVLVEKTVYSAGKLVVTAKTDGLSSDPTIKAQFSATPSAENCKVEISP